MATGTTLINRALRSIGAIASGASPSSSETADALAVLNSLLESWRNNKLFVYAMLDSSLTMVSTQSSYTIGSGGDLNITRPVKIDDAYMTISSVDTPVRLIESYEWDAIPNKTITSPLVELAYYNPTMTSSRGTLKVYPVPSATNVLHLLSWVVLDSLSAAGDTVTLPPGYDRMISSNLAIELAPEYSVEPSAALIKTARDSMAEVKRTNVRPILSSSELARLMPNRSTSRILYGP